jgi:hypothetical protein
VIGAFDCAQHLDGVGELLQAGLNPGQLGARVSEALKMPVEGFPGSQNGTFQICDPIRKRRAGGRNRRGQAPVSAATASFGAYSTALIDAAFFRHGCA